MLLRVQHVEDLFVRADQHVEPRRHCANWHAEHWAIENQHPNDVLHPGRAALGRRRDDDVVVPESEPLPPSAVRHEPMIPTHPATLRPSRPPVPTQLSLRTPLAGGWRLDATVGVRQESPRAVYLGLS